MIAADLERVYSYIEGHWGDVPKAWKNHRVMADEFGPFTLGAVLDALSEMFREGHDFAPKPPKVYQRTLATQARRYERGEDERPAKECMGDHVWGVVHYGDEECFEDCGVEHWICALCHEERM